MTLETHRSRTNRRSERKIVCRFAFFWDLRRRCGDSAATDFADLAAGRVRASGVISGALLYIRDEFLAVDRKTWLHVTIHWNFSRNNCARTGWGAAQMNIHGRNPEICLRRLVDKEI
ncbi:hypothetical protein GLYMA_03G029300v4 [Glycine max]|nr:hypothetical protein GLYMA_03G029300v4 [Glycine max]KAH1068409.1 hypothetical protein GYH30_006099 [Glycine max]|eukprot:XP_014628948.1 uncharacterized protein LOC106798029 isoform X1 [Glycine max]